MYCRRKGEAPRAPQLLGALSRNSTKCPIGAGLRVCGCRLRSGGLLPRPCQRRNARCLATTAFSSKQTPTLGVWYTPREVVHYQIQTVDRLLREELGCDRGLADEKVVVLDPCCGTGAYLIMDTSEGDGWWPDGLRSLPSAGGLLCGACQLAVADDLGPSTDLRSREREPPEAATDPTLL